MAKLAGYDRDNVPQKILKKVQPYLNMDDFTWDIVKSKSAAAADLCEWVIKTVEYCKVYKPKIVRK